MSLLMDALRKAEEAKKLAAKQASGAKETSSSAEALSEPALEDSLPLEITFEPSVEPVKPVHNAFANTAELEDAFEFEIDESFGMDLDNKNAPEPDSPASTILETNTSSIATLSSGADDDSGHSVEFDTSALDLPTPDTSEASTLARVEPASEVSEGLGLSLEALDAIPVERPQGFTQDPSAGSALESAELLAQDGDSGLSEEAIEREREAKGSSSANEYLQKADLEKFSPNKPKASSSAASQNEVVETPQKAAYTAPALSPEREPAPAPAPVSPMRAVREEADVASEQKRNQDLLGRKAGAAIESRKRESARAVFNAKSGRMHGGNRTKLVALVAALVVLPVGGVAFWLLDPMGLFGGGSQYNVPVAGYDPNRSFSDALTPESVGQQDVVLPDVSEVETLEQITAPEEAAIEQMEEQVAATIVPTLPVVEATEPEVEIELTSETLAVTTVVEAAPVIDTETDIESSAETQAVTTATFAPESGSPSDLVAEATPPTPPADNSAPINIVRSEVPQVDPQLSMAYSAYRDNDFVTARAHYQQALRNLPNNRDAMLGLAAVSLKIGDANAARAQYTKLLELDPRDPLARVGLLETVPASDSIAREGELKALFDEHPNIPQLAFALGNLQASQGRWNDAQQSYYDALLAAKSGSSGPITPDYAFNLAVSLERLNQLRPAYEFYREALTQSQTIAPSFDVRILRERLDALERALP